MSRLRFHCLRHSRRSRAGCGIVDLGWTEQTAFGVDQRGDTRRGRSRSDESSGEEVWVPSSPTVSQPAAWLSILTRLIFRTRRDQWMELKTQYLERRRYLQDQRQETRPTTLKHAAPSEPPQTSTANHPDEPTVPRFTEHNNPSSSDKIQCNFPRGCLVFVRNIHPETNKTTLKALLSQAFGDDPSGQELNYVDYTKGLDTVRISGRFCLVPLARNPADATEVLF